jgi:4a-hydroxytetrahydrobiopterin dehydratase
MVLLRGKEQPETLALPKPGAMRKTVGLSHASCATPRQQEYSTLKQGCLTDVSYNSDMWQSPEEGLYQAFEFVDFAEAFGFMTKVAAVAEQAQHHPRWTNEWNRVEIWLLSHEAGNSITDKDHQLAKEIDQLAKQGNENN